MKQRVITAVIAAAVFLPIVILGGWPFIAMVYLIASVALYEALKMKQLKLFSVPGILSLLLLWIFLIPDQYSGFLNEIDYTKLDFFFLGVLLFLTYTVITKNRFTFEEVAFSIMSTLYVGLGFISSLKLENLA